MLQHIVCLFFLFVLEMGRPILFFLRVLRLNLFLIKLSPFPLHLVSILMQAKQFTTVLHRLFSETTIFSQLATSIDEKHFLWLLILNVSHNKILYYLSWRNSELFYPLQVQSSHINSDIPLDVPPIHQMNHSLVLQLDLLSELFRHDLLAVMKKDLLLKRHSKAITNERRDLVQVGGGGSMHQQGLLFIVTNVDI